MDFEKQLERAINRGYRRKDAAEQESAQRRLTEDEFRTLHSKARLQMSDHVAQGLHKLADHFAGFDFREIVSADGWGAKITRDDMAGGAGRPMTRLYSHLELLVKPYSPAHILELVVRGAIRNKETLARSHYQKLEDLDLDAYQDVIDQWILEYAERFAMSQ